MVMLGQTRWCPWLVGSPAFVTPHLGSLSPPTSLLLSARTFTSPAGAEMRYIRFLKTPRVVIDKNTSTSDVYCLLTITSDLGDSFLPYDVQLSAELLVCTGDTEDVLVWRTVQWTGGMRSLPIKVPLRKSQASSFRLRVGVEPKRTHDEYASLSEQDGRGVVSAWSAAFTPQVEAQKLAERRFMLSTGTTIKVWEETGESIARHLW
jgi:hypothetical protein